MAQKKNHRDASTSNFKVIVYLISLVAALGGLLFGLDQGFIANSLETIRSVYNLDTSGGEKYSAILATGGVVGALLSGVFARFLGRKKSLIFSGFIFSAASLGSALLPSIEILGLYRFFLGFGVGIASFITPLYLSETAPASIRGSMGSLFQLMITIGIFLISLVNIYIARLVTNPHTALPLMFLVITIFAMLMFLCSFILPESPRWLMLKGRKDLAIKTLERTLNNKKDIDFEIMEINKTLANQQESARNIVFKGYFLKVLLIGIFLQVFQQLVGINMMIYYAPTIFGYAGMTGVLAMIMVPAVNMLSTFPAIRLVEKWGRKRLLYVGGVIMLITMIVAGALFHSIGVVTNPEAVSATAKTVLLLAVIGYIFGFAVSWGPVVWIVCSEIFPLKGREIGMTITTMVNWTFAGIVMRYSLSFMERFGNHSVFYLFSFFCVLAMIFVFFFVPETKGVTLEEIELSLKK